MHIFTRKRAYNPCKYKLTHFETNNRKIYKLANNNGKRANIIRNKRSLPTKYFVEKIRIQMEGGKAEIEAKKIHFVRIKRAGREKKTNKCK